MTTAMFHVKHRISAGKRGPSRGQDGANRGLDGASGGLKAAGLALSAAICAAMLSACSSPEDVAEKAGVGKATATGTSSGTASASATASAASAGDVAFEDNSQKDGGNREFAYKWPAAATSVPELAARFAAERDQALVEQKAEWTEALAEFAGQGCISCTSRGFSKDWQVVADLPRYLSLSAETYFYTGGAHGNSAFDALVWDRDAGAAIAPTAMFRSAAAMQDALGAAWCKALKAERTTRLGAENAGDTTFPCPPITDLTVLVGSSNTKSFDRIGLIAAPYVAGSYAEGPYEVTLPVTPAVLAAVKPEYKAAFALSK